MGAGRLHHKQTNSLTPVGPHAPHIQIDGGEMKTCALCRGQTLRETGVVAPSVGKRSELCLWS